MSNLAGTPKYLFTGNAYDPIGQPPWIRDMYWEKYTKNISNRGYLSIWTGED